ncbi:MAG: Multidrug resistance protein MdtE [Gemmatimonadaceae bacterium]|nr:Multidrug resistance protein MdtE [Gemmatimonadaceae bacterium]
MSAGRLLTGILVAVAACTPEPDIARTANGAPAPPPSTGKGGEATEYVVRDSTIDATLDASGVAEPYAQSTLSTKMVGTVIAVLVKEGDRVRSGDPLVRIDARDLDARRDQVLASIASAEAAQHAAELSVTRMRALFADSAAPRAHLDAAEAALARALAGVNAARASQAELGAIASYALVRAPFDGVVTQRAVDPGAFAAPGTPLLTIQDDSRLRLTVAVPPSAAHGLHRGAAIAASVEGIPARAVLEGVVPAAGSLYAVNAIVPNANGRFLSGSAAELHLITGKRSARFVPSRAIVREGDLTGVRLKASAGPLLRWVRLGRPVGDLIEVTAGLDAGAVVLVPDLPAVES